MRIGTNGEILIIQSQMKQYRVPFFTKLHAALLQDGIKLKVAYSDPPPAERGKRDNVDLPVGTGVKVKGYRALGNRVVWQPLVREVAKADLVVVEPANRYIMNHLLFLCSSLGIKRLAYFGLGENSQADRLAISEWYRRKMLGCYEWWFAYTAGIVEYLAGQGVPREKITAVQNSVDTRELREQIAAIPHTTVIEEKAKLGIPCGALVAVFCGMLEPVKALPFLIKSATLVKREISGFHLIIAGGGPHAALAQKAAIASGGWIHSVGPKFGVEKALILKMADVFTLPGRVGLAILDSFAAGLPLLMTDLPIHGPEAEYLEEGVNGLKSCHEVEAYAMILRSLLAEPPRLKALKEGAKRSAEKYSIEAMVQNFHQGITRCLGMEAKESGRCTSSTSSAPGQIS